MSIVDVAIKRPVTVWMFTFAVMLFGLVGLSRLAVNLLPELSYPTLTVRTNYTGAAPAEVEQLITKPIEEAVGVVKGLRKISSVSKAGQSDVLLEFEWDVAMDITSLEVREKLDLIRLPLDVQKPLILKFNPSLDPIVRLGLQTKDNSVSGLTKLRTFAEYDVKRQLESLLGVASVKLGGGLEQEYQVIIDQHKLAQLNLSSQEIINRINAENINVSAGKLIEGNTQYLVRTLNQFTDISQIGELVVYRENDQIIMLNDIATIVDGYKERTDVTRINAIEAVELAIYKEGDANTVQVAQLIKRKLNSINKLLGDKYELTVVYDQSTFISNAISEVKSAAIIGGLLAMVILYLFLRSITPTLIISLSIPVSVIATFNMMYGNGISLNIMSLGGIALATGLLVDNAIVVLENIARYKEQGCSVIEAARKGTKEVSGAIIASTLTTLAVFVPLIFVEGVAGQLFADQAMTVAFALIASLFVALTLIPMLASRQMKSAEDIPASEASSKSASFKQLVWHKKIIFILGLPFKLLFTWLPMLISRIVLLVFHGVNKVASIIMKPITAGFNYLFEQLAKVYAKSLSLSLKHSVTTLFISLLFAGSALVILPRIGVELLPPLAQGEFYVELELAPGTPLAVTDRTINQVAEYLQKDDRVKSSYSLTGRGSLMTSSADKGGEHQARLQVMLHNSEDEQQVMDDIRQFTRKLVGATTQLNQPELFTFSKPISIELASYDLDLLSTYSKQLTQKMESSPVFVDVANSQREGQPELAIHFNQQKIAQLGLNAPDIARLLAVKVGGNIASKYTLLDRKIDILVRSDEKQRDSVKDLRELVVNPNSDFPITLDSISDIVETVGPAQINRINQQRVAVISANIAVGDQNSAVAHASQLIEQLKLPLSVVPTFGGQSEEMQQSFNSMIMALTLAVFLVYLVMASQFESLLQPLLILFSVPLAGVGSIYGLYLFGSNISVIVFIGLIMLAGIVVNNAIVLVDRINQLRAQGKDKVEAIKQAAQSRLRPIIMTTLTTALGLLPMALGVGEGAELRTPMAITVISGLLCSTFLTLIILPALYQLFDHKRFNEESNKQNVTSTQVKSLTEPQNV
ncbi:efflux RND transporter permease subunit [Litorilituus lipolyticus]|uniref:Efflux RND transporter permease subunit n=1 Tax=Litorilituus lipolyticus TaxID=2491017 RepID=A0A502KY65_9GAMM|nr:efflux RND transporter permease subunit [Litorilituus lipolyticus]TPH15105.1 efflux RND transporter permease subunit [Litorilituus lipolyticus]